MPGIRQPQRSLVADDLEQVLAGEREAGVEVGRDFVRKPHDAGERDVDAVAADRLLARHPLGLAGDQTGAAHAVAADVHQRAAVERGAEPDIRRVVGDEPERGADDPDAADGLSRDELGQPAGLRVVAVHERLHQQPVVALGDVEGSFDFGGASAEWLLAQDVLAGLERA